MYKLIKITFYLKAKAHFNIAIYRVIQPKYRTVLQTLNVNILIY